MFKPLSRDAADPRLLGVIGPLVTTFDPSNGGIAISKFTGNIESHLGSGQSGVLVGGSTGEAALLDEEERAALVEAARGVVPGSAVLLVGVGAESTRQTVKRAKDAAARGADGVLVVSPHYYTASMNRDALSAHFTAVADQSPAPVLLYNIPKYAHLVIDPSLAGELAEHPNVVGIKDSSGDMDLLAGYIDVQRMNPSFTVLTGHGPTFATALKLGARGGILAVSLFTGDAASRVFDAWKSGNTKRSGEIQASITDAAREVVGTFGVPGVKAAMDFAGLHGGPVRSPLRPLDAERRKLVESLVASVMESASGSLV